MHPYASLMPPIIANLKRIRDALKVAKATGEVAPEGEEESKFKPYAVTRWVPGSGSMETQAFVEPGGGLGSSSKADAMKKDRSLKALMDKYARELAKCAEARRRAQAGGSTTLDDGSIVAARGRGVSIPCPAATAAAKAISAYIAAHYGGSGRSGGGGGGGW